MSKCYICGPTRQRVRKRLIDGRFYNLCTWCRSWLTRTRKYIGNRITVTKFLSSNFPIKRFMRDVIKLSRGWGRTLTSRELYGLIGHYLNKMGLKPSAYGGYEKIRRELVAERELKHLLHGS